jgi:hypothetical protein
MAASSSLLLLDLNEDANISRGYLVSPSLLAGELNDNQHKKIIYSSVFISLDLDDKVKVAMERRPERAGTTRQPSRTDSRIASRVAAHRLRRRNDAWLPKALRFQFLIVGTDLGRPGAANAPPGRPSLFPVRPRPSA